MKPKRLAGRYGLWHRQVPRLADRDRRSRLISPSGIRRGREDGTFSSNDFMFDRERNVYICPANKLLRTTGNAGADHKVHYRASRRDCRACPLKPKCSPNTPSRRITRDVHEDARDHRPQLRGNAGVRTIARRAQESRDAICAPQNPFAASSDMRLAGSRAGRSDEFHLAAIVQNLKTPRQPTLAAASQRAGSKCAVSGSPVKRRTKSQKHPPNREDRRIKDTDGDPHAPSSATLATASSLAATATAI